MTWTDACVDLSEALAVSPQVAERIEEVQSVVERAAYAEGLELDLVNGVIWVESRFNPRAKSSAGARGLMQVMPSTEKAMAEDLGIEGTWTDPAYNVRLGTRFLRRLLDRYGGRQEWALAAYNAGPGNVSKHGPGRWLSYVRAVERAAENFRIGRLRCRGTPLPPPDWQDKPARPSSPRPSKPRPPSPGIVPAPSSGEEALLFMLGLLAVSEMEWGD